MAPILEVGTILQLSSERQYYLISRERGWSREEVMTHGLAAANSNTVFEQADNRARQNRDSEDKPRKK